MIVIRHRESRLFRLFIRYSSLHVAISACVGGLWADMCFAHVVRRCTYVQINNYLNVILDFSFVPTSLNTRHPFLR